jgi:5-methylcytosine-specific restriction endonuclease McrA
MANVANNGGKWIRQDKRLAIYLRDDLCCVYCGCAMEDGNQMCLDHVTPQKLGGNNKETNLVTCCRSCNSAKGAKPLADFFAYIQDKGANVDGLAAKIKSHTKRSIRAHRKVAKRIIANRKAGK